MQTMEGGHPVEYSLLDYVAIAKKRWYWVALPVLLFAGLAAAWTQTRPPVYAAEARVLLADTASRQTLDPSSQNTGFLVRELSNEIALAYGDEVEQLVRDELGELPDVDITADANADVLRFVAEASTADDAARFANGWAQKYIEVKRSRVLDDITSATESLELRLAELETQRIEIRTPLDELGERIAATADGERAAALQREYDLLADNLRYRLDLVTSEAEGTVASLAELKLQAELASAGEARLVQEAAPPLTTTNAPLSRNLALGIVLGLLGGFGLALLAETRDITIKSAADVQKVTDLPVLAAVPEAKKKEQAGLELASFTNSEGSHANAYHKARSSLEFLSLERDIRSILVTSAGASEGKTTTSCNLALAFALVGKRTVLVDVDFRRGRIHKVFQMNQEPGISDVVIHGLAVPNVAHRLQEPELANLLVVSTGTVPPSPAAFVGTTGFLKTVGWMRDETDVLILDAPPLLAVSDPHTMAKHVDGVVLTAKAGATTTKELAETIEALRIVGAELLGIILAGVDESESYGRYYYYRDSEPEGRKGSRGRDKGLWDGASAPNGSAISAAKANGNGHVPKVPTRRSA